MFTNRETSVKKYTRREKFEIGYRMKIGCPFSEIEKEYGVSRSFAYELRGYSEKVLEMIDTLDPSARVIVLTESLIRKIVIALALICRSPLEGIWSFFLEIFGISVSVPKASAIITEASERAAAWDSTVNLENIKQGANDEIFQCGMPIFAGVDVESTYTYILEDKPDRKGDTWKDALEGAQSRGLNLEVCISDQGSGLLSGMPKAFPDADIQYDVFHEMMELGKEISRMERHAFSLIKKEYELEGKLVSPGKKRGRDIAKSLGEARQNVPNTSMPMMN